MSVITFSGVLIENQHQSRIRYNHKHIVEHIVCDRVFGSINYEQFPSDEDIENVQRFDKIWYPQFEDIIDNIRIINCNANFKLV